MRKKKVRPAPPAPPEPADLAAELDRLALLVARQVNQDGVLLHDRIDALKALTTYRAGVKFKGKTDEKSGPDDFRGKLGALLDGASGIPTD
jgi:hypothetical protein